MAAKRKKQARRKDEPTVPGWMWLMAGLVGGAAIAVAVWVKMPNTVEGLLPHPNPAATPKTASASSDTPEGNPPAPASVTKKTKFTFYELLPEKEVEIPDEELSARVKAEAAANLAAKQQQGLAPIASSTSNDGSAPLPKPQATAIPVVSTASPAAESTHVSSPAVATASPPSTPESSSPTPTPTAAASANAPEQSGQYLLQAGAFRNNAQADDLKARIAMLGLVGRVEVVQTPSGEMHRVRLGPYATASELNEAKQKLSGSGVQAVAIRVK